MVYLSNCHSLCKPYVLLPCLWHLCVAAFINVLLIIVDSFPTSLHLCPFYLPAYCLTHASPPSPTPATTLHARTPTPITPHTSRTLPTHTHHHAGAPPTPLATCAAAAAHTARRCPTCHHTPLHCYLPPFPFAVGTTTPLRASPHTIQHTPLPSCDGGHGLPPHYTTLCTVKKKKPPLSTAAILSHYSALLSAYTRVAPRRCRAARAADSRRRACCVPCVATPFRRFGILTRRTSGPVWAFQTATVWRDPSLRMTCLLHLPPSHSLHTTLTSGLTTYVPTRPAYCLHHRRFYAPTTTLYANLADTRLATATLYTPSPFASI